MLLFNDFLGRRRAGPTEVLTTIRDLSYSAHFAQYQHFAIQSLVAMHMAVNKEAFAKALATHKSSNRSVIVSDRLAFDMSRVSCKEVMLVHIWSDGILCNLPLQIMPDQASVHDDDVFGRLQRSLVQTSTPGRKKVSKRNDATRTTLLALCHSMFAVMPFRSLKPYLPASADTPTGHRLWSDEKRAFYNWCPVTHRSSWCLSPDLEPNDSGNVLRIMVFTCDEGSTISALFFFLAGFAGMRVFYHRDPPHRLSNLYINALKACKTTFRSVLSILTIHKYRRAPFGPMKICQ
jgi:hypothetical protein